MQKICQICSVLPPGGDAVGEGVLKLKFLLESQGINCSILTSSNQTYKEDTFHFFNNWGLLNIMRSVSLLKKIKTDVVIFHYPTSHYGRNIFVTLIALIYRLTRIKIISFVHEYSTYSILGKIRIFPLLIFSNRIITSDHSNYKDIVKIPNLKLKTSIITVGSNFSDNFFNSDKKDIQRHDRFVKNEKIDLLYFGYIMHGKGLEFLLNAFEEFPELREKFNLHIVGNIPEVPNKETLALIRKVQTSYYINYHGYLNREQLTAFFPLIDVVCLPYIQGVTIRRGSFMTAMGYGKLVLTTRSKIKIENLEHLKNVYFIENPSSNDIKQGLIYISKLDSEIQKKIGVNGKVWYFENYSENIYISKIMNVIYSLQKSSN